MELFKESLLGIWDGVRGHGVRKMKNNVEGVGGVGGVGGGGGGHIGGPWGHALSCAAAQECMSDVSEDK